MKHRKKPDLDEIAAEMLEAITLLKMVSSTNLVAMLIGTQEFFQSGMCPDDHWVA